MAGVIMKKNPALSELISALLLIVILVSAASIVLVVLTSQYPPTIIPDPRLEIWNETTINGNVINNTIYVQSRGGDPVDENEYLFRAIPISGTPYTFYSDSPTINNTSGNNNLTTGNTISFSVNMTPIISSVQVIYRNNGNQHDSGLYEVLMYEKKFLKTIPNSSPTSTTAPTDYYYIRLLTSGSGTVVPSGGTTTTLDGFTAVKVPVGTQISLTATATSGIINLATNRTEFWTSDHMNSTEADTISNAVGKTTTTFSPPTNTNQTVYFSFGLPESHITIFNLGGGGTVSNGSVSITDGGSHTFTVTSGDPFSALFTATGSGTISTLRWISGTATDGNSVISGGVNVENAANNTTFTYLNSSVTQDISLAVIFSPSYSITATTGVGGTISRLGVTNYSAGSTPTYTITASGENRSYEILVDGVAWTDINPALRTQTYTFSPLTESHTIHSRFAIQGVWGNYWGSATVNGSYNDPDNNRAVGVRNSNPWKYIESTTAWNKQLHHHIQLADALAMSIPATPAYSTLETAWPNGANRVVIGSTIAVGSGTDKDYFYVNWSGLMFIENAGSYRFWIRADDGIKLFIDGAMQSIDARAWIKPYPPDAADWYPCTTDPSIVIPGWHRYTIWYYENAGKAAAELRYQLPGTTSDAYSANFFTDLFYLVD